MTEAARPLHIGYVLRRFPEPSQTFVLNEIRALERLGHRVSVIALERPLPQAALEELELSSRRVFVLEPIGLLALVSGVASALRCNPRRFFGSLQLVLRAKRLDAWISFRRALVLRRHLRRLDPDHVHTHLYYGTLALWYAHRLSGRPFTLTAHARDIYVKGHYLPQQVTDARFTVTVCTYNRTWIARRVSHLAHRIHIIRPFLDQALIDGTDESGVSTASPAMRPEPNSGPVPLRLLSVGRLVPKKGMAVLIDAVHQLLGRGHGVVLTIIGDGRERRALEQLISRLGLGEHVALVGPREPPFVHAMLQAADCFVLAALRAPDGDTDATPTVLGEAMATGLPIVSTTIAGIPEVVPQGAGLLVPPNDPAALADALADISAMPTDQRRVMGKRGQQFVKIHWNGEKDVCRLIALFRQAIARGSDG